MIKYSLVYSILINLFNYVPLLYLAWTEHLLLSISQLTQVGFVRYHVIKLLYFREEDRLFI